MTVLSCVFITLYTSIVFTKFENDQILFYLRFFTYFECNEMTKIMLQHRWIEWGLLFQKKVKGEGTWLFLPREGGLWIEGEQIKGRVEIMGNTMYHKNIIEQVRWVYVSYTKLSWEQFMRLRNYLNMMKIG